jgi:Asp-tRNA(Asn)/Glu-tRNA(Gln) amidotransferase C subunit
MRTDEDVARAAALAGLAIPPEQLPRVATLLRRIEQMARMLEEVELDPLIDEQAPTWRP